LHVEDDPDDAFFFSRAIRKAKPECEFHREIHGEGAIAYLSKAELENKPGSSSIPNLMVLDLKLPGLSGFEVLSWTRAQAAFKTLPVIILSGSPLGEDRRKAFELGASDFIVKHSDYDQIAEQVVRFISQNRPPAPGEDRGLKSPSPSSTP